MIQADVIVSGGTLLTMNGDGRPIREGSIAVIGDKIAAVGKKYTVEGEYAAAERIDAAGCLVMPGLVNGHTHSAMTCFRGMADDLRLEDWLNNYIFPAEAKNVNRELVYWGTLLACAEMIRSGTTAFCDMYIFEDEVARAAKSAGMRCLVGEVLFDFSSPNCKSPEEGLNYSRMLIEKWGRDPLISILIEPHSLYTCSPGLLRKAKDLADRFGVRFGIHYLETGSELKELAGKFGMSPTAFLVENGYLDDRFIGYHCVHLNENDLSAFAEHGASVIHNPESNMKLASGVAPVPDMIKRGIPVGLGTDGCASNNNLDLFQEMDMAAKLHKAFRLDPTVMDAETVTRMATRSGADCIGMSGRIGQLVPGMQADLIILDFNKPHLTPVYNEYSHLVYAVRGSDVETVLINGRIVMRNRRLLTIDEAEVMGRVREIAVKIRESIHLS